MKGKKIEEGVYLHKGKLGYRLIYPYKNKDGTINWFNIFTGGSWKNLITVIIVVLFILGLSYAYYLDVKTCRKVISNPCDFCVQGDEFGNQFPIQQINISEIKDGEEDT